MKISFTRNKIIALSGAGVAIIGLFLPFLKATASVSGYKIASATVKFIEGRDGKLFLIALIAAAVLLVLKKVEKVCYSLTGLCVLATIYDGFINTGSDDLKSASSLAKITITRGVGFWLVLIGIIAFAVGAFLEFKSKDEGSSMTNGGNSQQPVQPVQPTYSAPVEPVQPVQPTYSAPVQPQQPSDNQNNSNMF